MNDMNNLVKQRKEQGLTQAQLANAANINLRTLQDYEQGRKVLLKASAGTVLALAKALNCSIEYLLDK